MLTGSKLGLKWGLFIFGNFHINAVRWIIGFLAINDELLLNRKNLNTEKGDIKLYKSIP